ncbi:EF-hand domain-containing protein [Halobaculum gomorrense]|uniref:Cobalamin biosynthesis protein n=1 Tax=Halobaculum gomorrense TaxID=43928 RepID=A0A1M5PGL0_9EURY|nr:cobalamin biosynthesis protein [Halobaculum gomorrense]SHH00851.1 hypothetical protein SAMN05443636_1593 [Halobaculum gomorrense]
MSDAISGLDAPDSLVEASPEAAYLWGRVAGDGHVDGDTVVVRAGEATAADRLAALFGATDIDRDRRVTEREYAHNTAVMRTSDEFTVRATTPVARQAAAAFGLPAAGETGGYRFDALTAHRRELLRGIVEGCGTVCYKSDANAVGISVVHDDRALLEAVQNHLDAVVVDAPYGGVNQTSSGGYWFGVADDAGPALGEWLYDGVDDSGLFAPQRRQKIESSIRRVRGGGDE